MVEYIMLSILNAVVRPLDQVITSIMTAKWRDERIDRPIFIIGVERSGTTLLYSLLANHPDLYWLSRLDSLIPDCPAVSSAFRRLVSRLLPVEQGYVAIPGTISRSKGLLPPSECLPYWRKIFKWGTEENYLIEDDYFTEEDVTNEVREWFYSDLRVRLAWSGKRRVLFKQPGLSLKVRFLSAVFPDGIFLHVIRNPIANFLSMVKAKESSREQFWGIKIPGWREFLQAPKELQAVLQIQRTLEIIERDIRQAGVLERFLRVRYEDITDNPRETLNKILEFCGLKWSDNLEFAIQGIRNRKESREFPGGLSEEVKEILRSLCERYGYS